MINRVLRIAIEVLCLALLLGTVVFLAVFWKNIPDSVPNSFGGTGQVESYAGKGRLLIFPVFMAVIYLLLSLVRTMRFRSLGREVRIPAPPLLFPAMKLAILAAFSYMTVCSALNRPLGAWYLPVFLTLILGPMAVYSFTAWPKMK